ncbi:MAG: hypothetical protein JNL50_05000 [Phycisphaerae bacterium]|nr:hypothetical protein [Phycisphaerae bacterium]
MNNAVKLALVTVLLGAAAFFVFRFVTKPGEGDAALDQETIWKCSNASCENIYRVTRRDRLKLQGEGTGTLPPCPKCAKLGIEVYECQFCKQVYEPVGHGSYPDNCPHCGKNLAGDSSKDVKKPKAQKTPGHQ